MIQLSFIWASYDKPSSSYCIMWYSWWGCRGNLTLITLRSERVKYTYCLLACFTTNFHSCTNLPGCHKNWVRQCSWSHLTVGTLCCLPRQHHCVRGRALGSPRPIPVEKPATPVTCGPQDLRVPCGDIFSTPKGCQLQTFHQQCNPTDQVPGL